MSEVDPLLAAVEALTKPTTTGVARKNPKTGLWERAGSVTHDPLLQQIHDRVMPSGENNGGAATAPNERLPFDAHMMYEYSRIASQIRGWAVEAGATTRRPTIAELEFWHMQVIQDRNFDTGWYVLQLRKWERHIRRLLSKTGSFIIEAACPICGATEWGNMIDGGGLYPIKVEYVVDDDGHLTDHTALCQACRTMWEGLDSVDELATELNEKAGV
jgi:hypothetical protein